MHDLMGNRILIVDDNSAIHEDFRKILIGNKANDELEETRALLFTKESNSSKEATKKEWRVDSAYQGEEALELIKKAIKEGMPYALAFIDARMPPGWDGVKTIQKIWEVDPEIQIVLCTAYSDYSWEEISQRLKGEDNLLILKKPFDVIEVQQLTSALTMKWMLRRDVQYHIKNLEGVVNERTSELKKANAHLEESLSLTRATIESTEEGILALDDEFNILIYNQEFLTLWDIPEQLINSGQSREILKYIASQIKEPSSFLPMILNLCKGVKIENLRELKLNSGRIFELYLHPRYIRNQVKGVVLSFREVTEKKHLEQQLLHQATHDLLTGLPNRVILMDRLQQVINYAKRNNLYVGVVMLDLDNFKIVNDSLGHKLGDDLLKQFAKRLQSFFRESDTVTRFGGDEFAIVSTSYGKVEELTARVIKLKAIFQESFFIENHRHHVSVSMGISVYPMDGTSPEELLKNADSALYHAKELGKNNFQFYTAELNDNLIKKIELETALQQAVEKEEFILHYQPLLKLNSDKIIGVEALLRWNSPTFGIVLPDNFIGIAEKTGLIIPIGKWILRTACLQTKEWQKTFFPNLNVAINISGRQLMQEDFVDFVKGILEESQLSPEHLELEVTETTILENCSLVSDAMKLLKEMGIKLSIDDFGMGYSSLNYLKFFPFDKIKIDKSFIQGLDLNMDDNNIVEAIINMTKSMGLQVLAEGVETKQQIEFLRNHHSNEIQGYYISSPLDPKDFPNFLKSYKKK